MKKNPFYRRGGRDSPNAGLKERIAWQLSKRPMTGAELANIFGMTLVEFRKAAKHAIDGKGVATISAERYITEDGRLDKIYTLERKPKRVVPNTEKRQRIFISMRSLRMMSNVSKEQYTLEAKRRAELIRRGEYRAG